MREHLMEGEGEPESGGVMPPAPVFHLPDKAKMDGAILGERRTRCEERLGGRVVHVRRQLGPECHALALTFL